MNRLRLDFSIPTNHERAEFVNEYIQRPEFEKRPLTEDELETIANYILFGRDENGKNSVQHKEVQIATRFGTWDRKTEESLDALIESPTFNEAELHPVSYSAPATKVTKEKFSRSEARKIPELAELLEPIWAQIDWTDLIINYYDLAHGKRKNPIRDELTAKFSEEEHARAKETASHLNQFQYLKKRHYLVELRREQFTYRDQFIPTIGRDTTQRSPMPLEAFEISSNIAIYPLGLKDDSPISQLIFRPFHEIVPEDLTQKELKQISNFYWSKEEQRKEEQNNFFDFGELEHIYQLFLAYYDIDNPEEDNSVIDTLNFYTEMTALTECQQDILAMKMKRIKNADIAEAINKKYGKTYTANYISTIFRQKILISIAKTAQYHKTLVENIFYPENFKKCNTCGKIYLIDTQNFVKKARSADGYSNRCKICDKKEREARKQLIKRVDKNGNIIS